ncbi:MAG: carboxypeptidase-like regulatory domain-containing protein, partial [Planctomycetota bacterium]
DERCVIVATAPGFVGREFALDAPEPGELRATRTLDRIEPMEVELEFDETVGDESVSAADVADLHDSFRASAGWQAFPAMFANEAMAECVDRHVDLETTVTVDRSPAGLRLSVPIDTRSLQLTFPDHLEVTSVDRDAVSESYVPNVVRIDFPRKRVLIGVRELPSIRVRALWEDDATPFHSSVSIARLGDYWVPSIGTRTDARGEFRVAIVVGSDRNTLARRFRFRFFDVESGYSFETEIPRSELESLGSPATFLVPRPRIVHLHVVSESHGSFVPAVAEVLVGERVVETDGRGRCVVAWPPGGRVLVSALGHGLRVLPEPSERIDHGPDSPLRVVLQPVPTLEVLLPRTEDVHLRIDTTSGVGLIAKDAHSDLEPEAWSLWHRRSSLVGRIGKLGTIDHTGVAGQIDYHPDDEGRIVESCLRTDIPLRLRVADRLGTTLAETEVQLDEARTVDLREAIEETRDIVVHVVDPNGTPVPIGKVKLVGMVNGSKLSSRTGYHGGRAHLRSIAPGDYTVTAWALGQDASDGATGAVSVTEGDAEITLTVVP